MSNKKGRTIAIVAMIFLFGMISFVTNLAAPLGNVWKSQPGIDGSNTWGMMGNMMNFLAYLIMGIPAGKILSRKGYRNTVLMAILIGLCGILVQFLSGKVLVGTMVGGLPVSFFVYLLGAFISGFCVCLLNTAVNPMLNILGDGGKRGNQYIQIGGTLSSLVATVTPMMVGTMVGELTPQTRISDVNILLYVAMAVFMLSFVILYMVPIEEPRHNENKYEKVLSPWRYRHFVLGAIAIFFYVGVEIGIPGTLNFYLSDSTSRGAGIGDNAVTIAGFAAGTYWFMMLVGRFLSTFIASKVSSRAMLVFASAIAVILVLVAMFVPLRSVNMTVFTGSSFENVALPLSAILLVLCGLMTSIMWGAIFNLAIDGLGKSTEEASGIFMMLVVGGGIMPLVQNAIADSVGYMASYVVTAIGLVFILWYAVRGSRHSKEVQKD